MGISAQELRIGNYILDETGVITIIVAIDSERKFWNEIIQKEFKATARLIMLDNFDWNTSYGCWVEKLKPIPLTEEWLLKMGFEKEIDDSSFIRKVYYYINDFEVEFHGNKLVFRVENKHVTNYFAHHTKYVHQLQNLIFSLSGEELKLKSE